MATQLVPDSNAANVTSAVGLVSRRDLWRRMRRSKLFTAGALTFLIAVLLCIVLPLVIPHDPLDADIGSRLQPPAWFADGPAGHILGTDALGRDVLARLVTGGRVSLFVATSVVVITTIVGLVLGLVAGYVGGMIDLVVMRLADLALAVPTLLLAIAIVAVVGGGVINLVVVLSLTGWMMMARVVRATVLAVRDYDFVNATRVAGLPTGRIIFQEVLPNVVSPMIITATQAFGGMILTEASMSFLGLGVPDPMPSWGGMIAAGREYIATSPWVVIVPGMALMITVLAVNFIGDGLNDVLNPQLVDFVKPKKSRRRSGGQLNLEQGVVSQ
jgi:peptide/nickel transport system permease protein